MRHERVLVLAVDLPGMTFELLQRMILAGDAGVSVVPYGRHSYEPVAACYARSLCGPAEAALAGDRLSLQALMAEADAAGLIKRLPLSPADEVAFANWNSPKDISS
jgi:molybdopterin-guanine dinucleotide biosynthesis protein A